ncbi:hypothetical protein [Polynucleobacter sp. 71A-WALBACH]|uniref:hypothetical protein n=1 Tax=Polynucleobacter sp. 71A-WALBACH TaxID=2689097 RepID=UPI001C0E231B|nr:hypothetical protein [Polynucleobacter sp. 71A-WALBACH]
MQTKSKNERPTLITVGQMKEYLSNYDDDCSLDFSGLDFYRLKQRSDKQIQVEFNQQVYRDANGLVVIENLE